jgi:glycerophosphoryl diester phosphodiesterase
VRGRLVSERTFSQEARRLVVAHRGASVEAPENTLAAYDQAVERGADAVEFDVRLTADGIPVVLHDPDLARTTDASGLVREVRLEELARVRTVEGHGIPTLAEALRLLSGRIAVDIELKNIPGEADFTPDGEPLVEATLDAIGSSGFAGSVLLSSFNPASIAHARRLAPEIPTGLLTGYDVDADVALAYCAGEGHPWVLPFVRMVTNASDGYAERVHSEGLRLGTWITDDPAEALALFRSGVDAVATNDPATVIEAREEAAT